MSVVVGLNPAGRTTSLTENAFVMDRSKFHQLVEDELRALFEKARGRDELSFLFAILGINSGMEDMGWQPIEETHNLVEDLVGLIKAPLHDHAKTRMALLLYCHVTEANFIYHCVYNMLLTIGGESPKIFNFLDKYRNGVPPTVGTKLKEIRDIAIAVGHSGIPAIFDEIFRPEIRNAFFHSDYILFDNELRLKHRGSEHRKIPIQDVFLLLDKTLDFNNTFFDLLMESRRSFPGGYKITGRKNAHGQNLSSIDVRVDEESGMVIGFSSSDPLPWW